ncbi:WD40 repeat domain-containing protein [Nonomuraea basaltis]|uniref:WD40 repeat domain-containing protein n=1 Tax=Nonomuraea basaltis TaxID=2495887 RepID=UPI00198139B6|nr:PD40 domain-containing protein [Nonomuraea basaltis]
MPRRRLLLAGLVSVVAAGSVPLVASLLDSPEKGTPGSGSPSTSPSPEVPSLGEPTGSSLITYTKTIHGVAFSPDGKTLAAGTSDGPVLLWDIATRRRTATLTGHTGSSAHVFSVAFSPGGRLLASGSGDNTVRLWNVSSGRPTATLTGHTAPVNSVAFSPDGKTLASSSSDETVRLWSWR